MAITALPTPPSRQDPTNFNDRADLFLGALPTFQSEANALQVDVNAKQVAAAASASNAAISEAAASNTANVSIWVSGTTYAIGVNRFSPSNFLTYRRKTAGAGTTDPSSDPTNWQLLSGLGDVSTTGDQSIAGNKSFTGRVLIANGSVSIPSIAFASDTSTDTGFYRISEGTIGIACDGASAGNIATGGNLTMTGNITAYSDERLKTDWKNIDSTFVEKLAKVKSGTFTRLDTGTRQAGVSAQSIQELLSEVVLQDEEGLLSVAYGNAALVACIELAKEVQALRTELKALKG